MNDPMVWHPAKLHKPKLTKAQRAPGQFGVQVIIHPPYKSEGASDVHVAFYGTRITDKPSFYIYGRCINVEQWMPLPSAPTSEVLPK